MSTEILRQRFPGIVAAYNPAATRAEEGLERVLALGLPTEIVETDSDYAVTASRLQANAPENWPWLAVGGDGILRQVGKAALMRNTLVVAVQAGNACDNARSYHGHASLPDILLNGREERVYPLVITVTEPTGRSTTEIALGYFGLGATAPAAQKLETLKSKNWSWRQKLPDRMGELVDWTWNHGPKQIGEVAVSLATVSSQPHFTIGIASGDEEALSDLTFCRGRYIAKYGRMHAEPFRREYEVVSTPPVGYAGAALTMVSLATGLLRGVKMNDETQIVVRTSDNRPIPAQYDGDTVLNDLPVEVPSGSMVSVDISKRSFRTITTRRVKGSRSLHVVGSV